MLVPIVRRMVPVTSAMHKVTGSFPFCPSQISGKITESLRSRRRRFKSHRSTALCKAHTLTTTLYLALRATFVIPPACSAESNAPMRVIIRGGAVPPPAAETRPFAIPHTVTTGRRRLPVTIVRPSSPTAKAAIGPAESSARLKRGSARELTLTPALPFAKPERPLLIGFETCSAALGARDPTRRQLSAYPQARKRSV